MVEAYQCQNQVVDGLYKLLRLQKNAFVSFFRSRLKSLSLRYIITPGAV